MTSDRLSTVFGALADPTRRAILARLAAGDASQAFGVNIEGHASATVRNCNIRGFYVGIASGHGGGGLTIEEIGEVLDISPATVKREWSSAKLLLYKMLNSE